MTKNRVSASREQVVRYDSPEAAKQVTVTGWVSRDGIFYGDNEHVARYAGCTHMVCDCGALHPKGYTACDDCRAKRERERWEKLPAVEWKGEPVCVFHDDQYFWSEEEVYEWCEEQEIKPSSLMLVMCEPQYARQIDEDYWSDDLPEDSDLPNDIAVALEAFNKVIRERKEPLCWYPADKRVVLTDREEA